MEKNWEGLLPEWCLLDGEPWQPNAADLEVPPVAELLVAAKNWPHEERPGFLQDILAELHRRWRVGKDHEVRKEEEKVANLCADCLRRATTRTQLLLDLGGALLIMLARAPHLKRAVEHYQFHDIKIVGNWILRTGGGQKMSLAWKPTSTCSAPRARSRRNPLYHR